MNHSGVRRYLNIYITLLNTPPHPV